MTAPTETARVGLRFRFWSEKVFGVFVQAKILKLGRKLVHCEANYHGVTWKFKKVYGCPLYYDLDHPNGLKLPPQNEFILEKP